MSASLVAGLGLLLLGWLRDALEWVAGHWFALLALWLLLLIRVSTKNIDRVMTSSTRAMDQLWQAVTTAADRLKAIDDRVKSIDERLGLIYDRLDVIPDGVHEIDASVGTACDQLSGHRGEHAQCRGQRP
jgi:hypothetical protein